MTVDEAIDGIVRPAVTLVRALVVVGEVDAVLDLVRAEEDLGVAVDLVVDLAVEDVPEAVRVRVDRPLDSNGIEMEGVEGLVVRSRRAIHCRRSR